jgi:cyclopropane fatty-acyl-phospholipid synthase-like methyltransferase
MRQPQRNAATMIDVVKALVRPLRTDRIVPPVPGTPAEAFEALYAHRPDPWGVLSSPLAQQRYLALVEAVAGYAPCRSILDVGCGEGALTRYLVGSASCVIGIDGSPTAIARARRIVPKATFICDTLETFTAPEPFDLVLAVEVLYYVSHPRDAIEQLLTLGRSVIVSYTTRERQRLDPHLDAVCRAEDREFHRFFGLRRHGFTIARLGAARGRP